MQALLSLGDRRAGDLLERAVALDGDWARAMRESPLDPDFFVLRGRGREELLPWDFVDVGLGKEALWRQYERALAPAEGGAC